MRRSPVLVVVPWSSSGAKDPLGVPSPAQGFSQGVATLLFNLAILGLLRPVEEPLRSTR